jgi:hypothetical protein
MGRDTDYTVRSWRRTDQGHTTCTVVDGHGRIVHVTFPYGLSVEPNVDRVIRHALASRPPLHPAQAAVRGG